MASQDVGQTPSPLQPPYEYFQPLVGNSQMMNPAIMMPDYDRNSLSSTEKSSQNKFTQDSSVSYNQMPSCQTPPVFNPYDYYSQLMYQNSQLMGQTIVMPDYGQSYPFSVKSSLNQENSMKSPDGFSDESVESPESNENSNQYVPLMPFVPLQSSTPNEKEQIRPDSRYIKSQPHAEVTTQKDRIRLDDGLTYNDGQYLYYDRKGNKRICPVCQKTFIYSHALKGHFVRVHLHSKRFTCTVCQAGFWSNSDLERHMPKHTGQKFICDTCGKTYTSKQRLTEHFRSPSSCWLEPTMLEFVKQIVYGGDQPST
ncbi:hypothetical protein FO519_004414 [Halicephalobus sp. NKZ332]|nr:hypothetical protein FO519_004414 [Halicephalobus sp. NKZ332]